MTPADFRAWRARLGLTQARAAAELGITRRMCLMYEKGEHSSHREADGTPRRVAIPRTVELACSALEIGPMSLLRRASINQPRD